MLLIAELEGGKASPARAGHTSDKTGKIRFPNNPIWYDIGGISAAGKPPACMAVSESRLCSHQVKNVAAHRHKFSSDMGR
jgi:hypothetical protein